MNETTTKEERIKQAIIDRIQALDKLAIDYTEAYVMLTPWLIKAMPIEIQEAYEKMIMGKLPF